MTDRSASDYWLNSSDRELSDAYAEQAAYEAAQADEVKREDAAWLNGLIGDALRGDNSSDKSG
jgi:hypothetical protein